MFLLFTILFNVLGNNPAVSGYQIGDKAADFSLKATDGKMISMNSFPKAKGYIIVFTCNHCPYAVMYEDRLNDLSKKYTSKGYQLIAINPNDPAVKPDDSYDKMIVRTKEKSFTFPYLFDEGQQIYPKFGATKTPHVFLLNQDKIVKYIGAIDNNAEDANAATEFYLENAISALENGKDPNPSTTKAIGCSIKVKK